MSELLVEAEEAGLRGDSWEGGGGVAEAAAAGVLRTRLAGGGG
jgi:hypothetical protein